MIIYIVLGIAADDIFVFYDAWKQSAEIDKEILDTREKRLAYSFRRAVRAMAITSSTTAVAFFANAFSPLLSISAFGIFAGVIVPVNYLLVIMIFPPAVIWYEDFILNNESCSSCLCWAKCSKCCNCCNGCFTSVSDELTGKNCKDKQCKDEKESKKQKEGKEQKDSMDRRGSKEQRGSMDRIGSKDPRSSMDRRSIKEPRGSMDRRGSRK